MDKSQLCDFLRELCASKVLFYQYWRVRFIHSVIFDPLKRRLKNKRFWRISRQAFIIHLGKFICQNSNFRYFTQLTRAQKWTFSCFVTFPKLSKIFCSVVFILEMIWLYLTSLHFSGKKRWIPQISNQNFVYFQRFDEFFPSIFFFSIRKNVSFW